MFETLEKALESQGVFALLFLFLLLYVLKETEKREQRSLKREGELIGIINSFKTLFNNKIEQINTKVDTIKVDVDVIKENMKGSDKRG